MAAPDLISPCPAGAASLHIGLGFLGAGAPCARGWAGLAPCSPGTAAPMGGKRSCDQRRRVFGSAVVLGIVQEERMGVFLSGVSPGRCIPRADGR